MFRVFLSPEFVLFCVPEDSTRSTSMCFIYLLGGLTMSLK